MCKYAAACTQQKYQISIMTMLPPPFKLPKSIYGTYSCNLVHSHLCNLLLRTLLCTFYFFRRQPAEVHFPKRLTKFSGLSFFLFLCADIPSYSAFFLIPFFSLNSPSVLRNPAYILKFMVMTLLVLQICFRIMSFVTFMLELSALLVCRHYVIFSCSVD